MSTLLGRMPSAVGARSNAFEIALSDGCTRMIIASSMRRGHMTVSCCVRTPLFAPTTERTARTGPSIAAMIAPSHGSWP